LKEWNEKIPRERFIRLGAAMGMSIGGASALTACGEESSEGSANGAAKSNKLTKTSGGKAPAGGQEIARTSRVPVGSAARFTNSGSPAVLVHLPNGKFAAYSALCTHQGCTVTYQNGQLLCPCHGSVFDPSKGGAVLSGPALSPLPQIPIKEQGGGIYRT